MGKHDRPFPGWCDRGGPVHEVKALWDRHKLLGYRCKRCGENLSREESRPALPFGIHPQQVGWADDPAFLDEAL